MTSALDVFYKLDALTNEASRRPIRRRELSVIDYKPVDPRPETHLALEGTITILAARPQSRLMAAICAALDLKDGSTEAVARQLYLQYKGRRQKSLPYAIKTALAQPVFADVMHGDLKLLENLFVPDDLEVALLQFPYNGGKLAKSGIALIEHPASEEVAPIDVVVLRHAPSLTKAEIAAIEKVPAEQNALNLGYGPGLVACSVVLLTVAVVVEVAVVAVTFAVTGGIEFEPMERLDAGEISEMGAAKTARVLVEMRRRQLQTKPARTRRA